MKSRLLKTFVLAFATFLAVSCTPSSQGGGGGSSEPVDYASGDVVRLKMDYKGHDFYKDGVGQVTLKSPIDGDTAHFYPVVTTTSSTAIKSRFWGIDTPESTGKIEEYGAEASDFTKAKLKEADANGTIVVSAPILEYGEPATDSTGSRYLSIIWISLDKKDCPFNELKCLNLMVVQEGLSYAKNVGDLPDYADVFIAAENQARAFKLNMFSGLPAPKFNYGDYQTASLLDIKHDIEKALEGEELDEDSLVGAKVRIVGTIAGISDGTMFLQNFYTVEQGGNGNVTNPYSKEAGEYAGINLYCGMTALPSRFCQGAYIEVCGTVVNSEIFGYQLTGASFKKMESGERENDAHVILSPEQNIEEYQLYTFSYSVSTLNSHINSQDKDIKFENMYCSTRLNEAVECTRFYKSDAGDMTLTFGNNKFQAYITTALYKGNPHDKTENWNTEEQFVGKSFYISGVYSAFTNTSDRKPRYQFVFTDVSTQLLCTEYYNADGSLK